MSESSMRRPGEVEDRKMAEALPEDEGARGLLGEFLVFLREERKWWLLPMMLTLAVIGVLLFVGTCTPLSPFIYSLF